jgi:hypothetical protein
VPILIDVQKKDGAVLTQTLETEGEVKAVRNYNTPAAAIEYLNSVVAYYNQPSAPPALVEKGNPAVNDAGEDVLRFSTIQGALVHLTAQGPAAAPAAAAPAAKEGEQATGTPAAAAKPGEAAAGAEGEVGKPKGGPEASPAAPSAAGAGAATPPTPGA